jgi:zinc/manganese transport system ATP-binding protein
VKQESKPALSISRAELSFGETTLWQDLNLEVSPGEVIAVIGSNGSGKSSLLKAILGQEQLTHGQIKVAGHGVRRGSRDIGYIPQHRPAEGQVPIRGRELLRLGLDGHKFGLALPNHKNTKRVDEVLARMGASEFSKQPIGSLSGGQLQRLRVGQAVIGKPALLLADEPLTALDLNQQQVVCELIDQERKANQMAVLFVTHDVNPILDMVDRVLYLANGRFKIGTPDEVLRSEVLSELYGTQVDVLRNQGRIVVVGTHDHAHHPDEEWI